MQEDTLNDSVIIPPKSMSELAIHIGYMRRDIMNLSSKVDSLGLNYVTKEDLKEIIADIESLKTFKANYDGARDEAKRNARWSGGTTGGVIGTVIVGLLELVKYLITKHV